MSGTFWAFLPAMVAIVLALLTKKVYLSLFIGIFVGAVLFTGGNVVEAFYSIVMLISEKLGENGGILVFLVVLGIFAVILAKTGGTVAYGEWAARRLKSKKGAALSAFFLGVLIFVDDYFNCLTVGSVMRPVTDKFRISRAKLAYIIDSTAAPVCIIAPISSWAAAVSGFLEGDNAILAFVMTIPFNLYAILTLVGLVTFTCLGLDIGKMRKNERLADETGDLLAGEYELPSEDLKESTSQKKGKVWHLIVPIVLLIVCCVLSMIYTGFYYNWDTGLFGSELQSENVIQAFSNCEAGLSLGVGSIVALIITFVIYIITGALSFKGCMDSLTEGFKSMVPAVLILVFAWTLSGVMGAKGGYLDAKLFVQNEMSYLVESGIAVALIPCIFFLLAALISFATGTSWGTFGILIPVAISILGTAVVPTNILAISSILAGSVFGDHVSPISDTTIMASSGAQCNHVDHVKTQLPYALSMAMISFVAYLIAGFVVATGTSYLISSLVTLGVGLLFLAAFTAVLLLLRRKRKLNG
ncbi:MAG: Na+/H+ antiporter NhaC family protein [Ruminococcaceae bacterium]|nr:Na+/H+ antiporter NhaC family protein [Oscillospiraceae bacterium]